MMCSLIQEMTTVGYIILRITHCCTCCQHYVFHINKYNFTLNVLSSEIIKQIGYLIRDHDFYKTSVLAGFEGRINHILSTLKVRSHQSS